MNITQITEMIAESLPAKYRNDLPAIRQALNDAVDQAVRDGEMTEAQANAWDQDHAVKRVQSLMGNPNAGIVAAYPWGRW